MLRNIHPLLYMNEVSKENYEKTVGFSIVNPVNWFDYRYSDQHSTGFETTGGGIFQNCFSWWCSDEEETHVAFRSQAPFFGSVDTFVLGGKAKKNCANIFAAEETVFAGTVRNVVSIPDGGNAVKIR